MAIFSRRSLQRLLQENASLLSIKQSNELVGRLNLGEIPAEWEVVLLNAFSNAGSVGYEKNFGGHRKGDIYFEDTNQSGGKFLAEVTTVSDDGLDKLNPVEDLIAELNGIARRNSINPVYFSLRVGDGNQKQYKGGPKARLKLPRKAHFEAKIFGPKFHSFLSDIKQQPAKPHRFEIKNSEIDLTLDYLPKGLHLNASWTSYKVVYSLTENRIYSALHDKDVQLQNTQFKGPIGIFLCDGGCRFLAGETLGNLSYTPKEVIYYFLREHDSISFVVTFVVRREHPFVASPFVENPYRVFSNLYKGQCYNQMNVDMEKLMVRLKYPQCQWDAQNALRQLKAHTFQGRYHGGMMKTTNEKTEVRISARNVFELFAGRITQQQFFERHSFLKDRNPFEKALQAGSMIGAVTRTPDVELEITPENDDDWIVFTFPGPDPALSPFFAPRKKESIRGSGK